MEEIAKIISSVGFPIAIATYVIVVLNKTLNENTLVLTKLVEKLDGLEARLDDK